MGILRRFFQPDYTKPDLLRGLFNTYFEEWSVNNARYAFWKPDTILPGPKLAIKSAMKLGYAEWPEPIDWTIFGCFFMEFVDLALHLPADDYAQIDKFNRGRVMCGGLESKHDPLLMYRQSSTLAPVSTVQDGMDHVLQIRDEMRRSKAWDPIDADDGELANVRRILLDVAVEFASLAQEWRFYIVSIGREKYIDDRAPH